MPNGLLVSKVTEPLKLKTRASSDVGYIVEAAVEVTP